MWGPLTNDSHIPKVAPDSSNIDDSFFSLMIAEENKSTLENLPQKTSVIKNVTADHNDGNDGWDEIEWETAFAPIQLSSKVRKENPLRQAALDTLTDAVCSELQAFMLDFADPQATVELNEDLNEKVYHFYQFSFELKKRALIKLIFFFFF